MLLKAPNMLFTTFYMLLTSCAHGINCVKCLLYEFKSRWENTHVINVPDKFNLKSVIPVELHKKLHGPQVV
jgi:hypothetical protein